MFTTFHVILAADALSLHRRCVSRCYSFYGTFRHRFYWVGVPVTPTVNLRLYLVPIYNFIFISVLYIPVFIFVKRNVSFKILFNAYITSAFFRRYEGVQ